MQKVSRILGNKWDLQSTCFLIGGKGTACLNMINSKKCKSFEHWEAEKGGE